MGMGGMDAGAPMPGGDMGNEMPGAAPGMGEPSDMDAGDEFAATDAAAGGEADLGREKR